MPLCFGGVAFDHNRGAAGAREVERYTVTPAFIASAPKAVQVFWAYGFGLGIMAEVMITVNLQQDIQNKLSLSNRNVQAATDAILGPLGEIFSFIEETMTVRISQAMGSNDKARTNRMVKIGVVSALVLGLAASTVATVLAFIAPVFRAIINPGVVHDHNTYSGCELLPNNTALADSTAPFWIMSAAQYPASLTTLSHPSSRESAREHWQNRFVPLRRGEQSTSVRSMLLSAFC